MSTFRPGRSRPVLPWAKLIRIHPKLYSLQDLQAHRLSGLLIRVRSNAISPKIAQVLYYQHTTSIKPPHA